MRKWCGQQFFLTVSSKWISKIYAFTYSPLGLSSIFLKQNRITFHSTVQYTVICCPPGKELVQITSAILAIETVWLHGTISKQQGGFMLG